MGRPFHLVIVGGGATGSIVLLKATSFPIPIQITILEPNPQLGLGRAYSTRSLSHLLNVPTKKMAIFREKPEDFDQWVLSREPRAQDSSAWPFVPRIWFGAYLKEKLKGIKTPYTHLQRTAKAITKSGGEFKITLGDGSVVSADGVVVATGFQETISPRVVKGKDTSAITTHVLQPYGAPDSSNDLQKIGTNDFVLIVGTGLTAIDVFRQLRSSSTLKNTQIHFLSRRGLFPISHDLTPQTPVKGPLELEGVAPLESVKKLRSVQKEQSLSWVAIADHVRIQVQKIWKSWGAPERKQFVRHLKPYWENIRHRIPPAVALELGEYLKANPGRLHAGRIQSTEVEGDLLKVSYRDRHSLATEDLWVNWIVLANGAELSDALSLENLQAENLSQGSFWCVGPASRDQFWEITSIPDIVPQLDDVIAEILEKARSYTGS
jgi:uncharacterized NAD(P)/FAD-binding protein YdhS